MQFSSTHITLSLQWRILWCWLCKWINVRCWPFFKIHFYFW